MVCPSVSLSAHYSLSLSLIHSGHFCNASSSPLLLRSATDTARILCLSFTPKRHRQLRVKDLPKVHIPGGKSGIRTHDSPVERLRLYQIATTTIIPLLCL